MPHVRPNGKPRTRRDDSANEIEQDTAEIESWCQEVVDKDTFCEYFFWNSFFFKLSDYSKFNTFSKQLNNTVSAVNSTPMDTPPLTSVLNPSKLLLLNRGHEVARAAAATLTIVCHPSLRSDGVKSPLEHANGESFNPCACLWQKPVKIEGKKG